MKEFSLRGAVVFAILMENNDGILGKSPDYILEKLNSAQFLDEPESLLDFPNMTKFTEWQNKWHRQLN